ncbi:MAG TPA: hypothetical protein VFK80_00380, partial [Limnochordia bacterium]|nr:hypothetical protein [Limnochordia bacterium]
MKLTRGLTLGLALGTMLTLAGCGGVANSAEQGSTDSQSTMSTDAQAAPTDSQATSTDSQAAPTDSQAAPTDSQ